MSALVFQCPACRALVGVNSAALEPGRAGLRCEACGAVAWLPDQANRTEARVVDVEPAARSPKARELPPPSVAMVVAPAAAAAHSAPESSFGAEPRARIRERLAALPEPQDSQRELAAEFDQLLDAWHGDAKHKALLKHASRGGELAFVGQRYRAVLDVIPNDAAARRAQGEILTLAMAAMSATRDLGALREDPAQKSRRRMLAASVLLLAFAAVIMWALRERTALLRDDAGGAKMLFDSPAEVPAR